MARMRPFAYFEPRRVEPGQSWYVEIESTREWWIGAVFAKCNLDRSQCLFSLWLNHQPILHGVGINLLMHPKGLTFEKVHVRVGDRLSYDVSSQADAFSFEPTEELIIAVEEY